jgi:hypothetical protein
MANPKQYCPNCHKNVTLDKAALILGLKVCAYCGEETRAVAPAHSTKPTSPKPVTTRPATRTISEAEMLEEFADEMTGAVNLWL